MIEPGRPADEDPPCPPQPTIATAKAGSPDRDHVHRNGAARVETPMQRVDRNFYELLQEVRVAQIGVQVFFGFLLMSAFSPRFPELTPYQRGIFVTALLLTVVATSLLAAPAAYHRVLFRHRVKDHVVDASNRFAAAGLVVLVFAMSNGLLLVLDMVVGRLPAFALTTFVVCWFGCWWYAVPMSKRLKHQHTRPGRNDL